MQLAKWEYLEVSYNGYVYVNGQHVIGDPNLYEYLNARGLQGWEMFSTHSYDGEKGVWLVYLFKRPLPY